MLGATTTRFSWPMSARADATVRRAWVIESDIITRAPDSSDNGKDPENVLWTTLMRVDDKLAAPLNRWYLWHSTHDTPILRLYTAADLNGSCRAAGLHRRLPRPRRPRSVGA